MPLQERKHGLGKVSVSTGVGMYLISFTAGIFQDLGQGVQVNGNTLVYDLQSGELSQNGRIALLRGCTCTMGVTVSNRASGSRRGREGVSASVLYP